MCSEVVLLAAALFRPVAQAQAQVTMPACTFPHVYLLKSFTDMLCSRTDNVKHALHMDQPHSTVTGNSQNPGMLGASTTSGMTGHNPTPTHTRQSPSTSLTGVTAGPHSSNIGNKLDPRVDSDLDGSRTVGNTTGSTGTGYTGL